MRIFEHNRCQCAKSDTFQSQSFVMLCEHCKRCLKCILFHFTFEFCKLLHQAGPLSWFGQFFVLSFDCNSILCYRQYPPIVSDLYPLHFSEYNHVECEPCRSSTRTRTSASTRTMTRNWQDQRLSWASSRAMPRSSLIVKDILVTSWGVHAAPWPYHAAKFLLPHSFIPTHLPRDLRSKIYAADVIAFMPQHSR